MKPRRRPSVSLNGPMYQRLAAHCRITGVSIASVVEQLAAAAFAELAPDVAGPVAALELRRKQRQLSAWIEVPQHVDELLADAATRVRQLEGRTVTRSQLLEAAIHATLDAEGAKR